MSDQQLWDALEAAWECDGPAIAVDLFAQELGRGLRAGHEGWRTDRRLRQAESSLGADMTVDRQRVTPGGLHRYRVRR